MNTAGQIFGLTTMGGNLYWFDEHVPHEEVGLYIRCYPECAIGFGKATSSYLLQAMQTHLSPLELDALAEFGRRLRARLGSRLTALTLFGSRARGEGRDDSDLDLLVLVTDLSRTERRSVQETAFDVGMQFHLVLSPLVADVAAWRVDFPLGRTIAREGLSVAFAAREAATRGGTP